MIGCEGKDTKSLFFLSCSWRALTYFFSFYIFTPLVAPAASFSSSTMTSQALEFFCRLLKRIYLLLLRDLRLSQKHRTNWIV